MTTRLNPLPGPADIVRRLLSWKLVWWLTRGIVPVTTMSHHDVSHQPPLTSRESFITSSTRKINTCRGCQYWASWRRAAQATSRSKKASPPKYNDLTTTERKKSNEMELVMGFYTNAGVRVLFVVGMCADEVGKLNADLPGLGCVFKRWCGVTHANKPPTSSRSSKLGEGLSTWPRSKTTPPQTFKETLPQSKQRTNHIIVFFCVIIVHDCNAS